MEKSAILKADILDIIFEGRNKEYGAYELRRTYNKRLRISMLVMIAAVLLLYVGQLFAGKASHKAVIEIGDVSIAPPPPPDEITPPPPPPPPKMPPPEPVKMKMYTPPVITNEEVKPDEKPPEMDELANTQIGTKNQDGKEDDGLVAPPMDDGNRGVIEPPKKPKEDSIFIKVEKESEYPGGPAKWQRFLQRNMDNNIPQSAIDNEISGTVLVEFIVDKEGNVSNVHALSGPEELKEFCVTVIKKSGKWIPALQNGQNVKSYKRQPITIRLVNN